MIEKFTQKLNSLELSEITEKEAREQFKVYPDLEITNKGLLDIVTYVLTDNGYLVPLRFSFQNEVLNLHELRGFLQMVEYNCGRTRAGFNGLAHFEGKSNYIYPDGLVVSLRKIV